MHSIEELGTNVPAFLAKLWKIVEDPEINDLICWSPGGQSFYIRNQARFARELLPLYYKHNNMASFVRQLNMYGFHKVVSIEGGGLRVDKDEMEFAHQCFLQGHPYLLEHIKRKIPTSKVEEGRTGSKPELMNKVLADVKTMKGRQDSLDTQLSAMKRENEVLWREVAILRQKHLKQQQIVNKLIQFLVSMVQSSRNGGLGIKRHYPLMLNDTSHRPSKVAKVGTEFSELINVPNTMSPTGPVIHEIDAAELLEECTPNPENTGEENFLPSELCNVVITNDPSPCPDPDPTAHPSSNSNHGSPDPTSGNPSPQILLELAEDCQLSPSVLYAAAPSEVNPAIVTPRISKGKLRTRGGSTESKKRKSKKPSSTRVQEVAAQDPLAISAEDAENLVNGVNLLDVLPTLVNEKAAGLLGGENSEKTAEAQNIEVPVLSLDPLDVEESMVVGEQLNTTDPLVAATDAAISAITSVAAASKSKSLKSSSVPSGKNVSKTPVVGLLPVTNNSVVKKATTTAETNKEGMKSAKRSVYRDVVPLLLKQEPSTSIGNDAASCNILACTGNSSDENSINRSGVPDEIDNHVDAMQNELDSLRDLLKGEGYSLDANTLLGVCAAIPAFEQDFMKLFSEDPIAELPTTGFDDVQGEQDKENTTSGNELATYSSNLLDMVDMFEGSGTGDWSSPASPDSNNLMDVSLSELNTPQMTPSAVSKRIK